MKTVLFAGTLLATLLAGSLAFSPHFAPAAQGPPPNDLSAQRAAMQKLAFLRGRWSGPATVVAGPGRTLHLTQTEKVQYKLGGLVLLVEGQAANPQGKALFRALATIAYDDASRTYRFRAYHNGRYLDTALSVVPDGFSWGFAAGPAQVTNTMHLTPQGQWHEVTETSFRGGPAHSSVEMTLRRVQ